MKLIGIGFGIILSSLTTRYRDLSILVTFSPQTLAVFVSSEYELSLGDHVSPRSPERITSPVL